MKNMPMTMPSPWLGMNASDDQEMHDKMTSHMEDRQKKQKRPHAHHGGGSDHPQGHKPTK